MAEVSAAELGGVARLFCRTSRFHVVDVAIRRVQRLLAVPVFAVEMPIIASLGVLNRHLVGRTIARRPLDGGEKSCDRSN